MPSKKFQKLQEKVHLDRIQSQEFKEKKKSIMIQSESTISNRWKVIRRIGTGGQGRVYNALDTRSGCEVAIKVRTREGLQERLYREALFLGEITEGYENDDNPVSPNFLTYKQVGDEEVLIMDLMGPSLHHYFKHCQKSMSKKELIVIFKKAVSCLEKLHAIGIVHRDIKPENICFGRGDNSEHIYLIDFGLASFYRDQCSGEHFEHTFNICHGWTETYASLNQQMGGSPCRKDDLESLCYSFMSLEGTDLPWDGIEESSTMERNGKIVERKSKPVLQICKKHSTFLFEILSYLKQLPFEATPDYSYIQGLLDSA